MCEDGTEAGYYNSQSEDFDVDELLDEIKNKRVRLVKRYETNKESKVGTRIECPVCRKSFVKKSYQQAFDKTQCKDSYWNYVDHKRFIRTLRMNNKNTEMFEE